MSKNTIHLTMSRKEELGESHWTHAVNEEEVESVEEFIKMMIPLYKQIGFCTNFEVKFGTGRLETTVTYLTDGDEIIVNRNW